VERERRGGGQVAIQRATNSRIAWAIGGLVLGILLAGLAGGGPSASPTPTARAAQATTPAAATASPTEATEPLTEAPTESPTESTAAEEPHTERGSGTLATRPFELAGGDYTVTWTVTADSGCFHRAMLRSPDDESVFENAGDVLLDEAGSGEGETQVYGLDAGRYYLDVNSGCDWEIAIAPLE